MKPALYRIFNKASRSILIAMAGAMVATAPTTVLAELIWDGHFNEKNFLNYHHASNPDEVRFHQIPVYGRPIQYGGQHSLHVGNGELLSLESTPSRGSNYSAKFTVKSSAGGGIEPDDCDPSGDTCDRRRSQVQLTTTFTDYYKAIPYGAERWLSFSVYLPADWEGAGSGFGVVIWGSKGRSGTQSGWAGLQADKSGWKLVHRFSKTTDTSEWWRGVTYTANYPNSTDAQVFLQDFPDENASKAALANLNRGGWTDFIWHFKTDVRDVEEGNDGFLNVYMRSGSGDWVHVLGLLPLKDVARSSSWASTHPERIYDRGIGHYDSGGFGSNIGLYMSKGRVWDAPTNMSINVDNYKVGNEKATFSIMTHDRSSPSDRSPPSPPGIGPIE